VGSSAATWPVLLQEGPDAEDPLNHYIESKVDKHLDG
jgi:hypothetical protein